MVSPCFGSLILGLFLLPIPTPLGPPVWEERSDTLTLEAYVPSTQLAWGQWSPEGSVSPTPPPQTCSTSAGISGTVGGHRIFWKEWGPQPHPLPVGWAVLGNGTISVSLGISESQPGELKPDLVPVLSFLLWGSEPCPPSACFPDPTPPGTAGSQVWRLGALGPLWTCV